MDEMNEDELRARAPANDVFFTATNTDIGFCLLTLLYQKMGASLRLELADELVERMARLRQIWEKREIPEQIISLQLGQLEELRVALLLEPDEPRFAKSDLN